MTPLQEHIFKIMSVVHDVCGSRGIPYFLVGGTLLGALRHKGFIPWDDDADIGMLRPDYGRFLDVCATALPEGFALRHYSVEKHVYFAYAKIEDTRTQMRVPCLTRQSSSQHVGLDIFPMDSVPGNTLKHRAQKIGTRVCRGLLEVKYANLANPHWRNKMLVRFVRPMLPSGRPLAKFEDWMASWETSGATQHVWAADTPYHPERSTYPREWVAQRRLAPFEGGEFWIPAEAERCMEKTYGDYMTPPPPEKRVTHECELLEP